MHKLYDQRFPIPTQETLNEWQTYLQRADDIAYRLSCQLADLELDRSLQAQTIDPHDALADLNYLDGEYDQ